MKTVNRTACPRVLSAAGVSLLFVSWVLVLLYGVLMLHFSAPGCLFSTVAQVPGRWMIGPGRFHHVSLLRQHTILCVVLLCHSLLL